MKRHHMNRRIGRISSLLHPDTGRCFRCLTTWQFVTSHTTWYDGDYGGGRGCFPLCEKCWVKLGTPEKRMPYYDQLIRKWSADLARAAMIREAVLAGK